RENSSESALTAPLITEVSKPNRNPPTAAAIEIPTTFAFRCWAGAGPAPDRGSGVDMAATPPRRGLRCGHRIPSPPGGGAGTGQTVRCAGGGARAGPCSLLRGGLEPLELLLRDRRIELDEDRGGLGDRLAGCDRSVLPGGDVGVVAGDDGVARPAVEILDL